jgi:hypothetical protein
MKQRVLGSVVAGVLAMAAMLGAAAPAYADATCGGGCGGGWAKVSGGVRFLVQDTKADGYGVMGFVYRKSDRRLLASEYNGKGSGGRLEFTLSVASGATEFQMCLVDGPNHETIRCNDKRTVTF